MNREIKFRAWNGEKMTEPFDLDELAHHYDNEYFVDYWGEIPYDIFKDNAKVMQYTGLKDKNRKEIYEGDILRHTMGGDWQDNPSEVCWGEYGWCPWDSYNNDSYTRIGGCEIIGIHLS